ncbi:MAG: diphthine synthase [Candidatus Thermoplasmatota archaeon]
MEKGKLTFIGLGLYDEKDISLKGIEEIKKADIVFAEFYTSQLVGSSISKIENTIGKKINVLNRKETENGDKIIGPALSGKKIVFLTGGDTMTATTHIDLRMKAIKKDLYTELIHGNSITTAVPGLLGLQNYKFGRSTTLVFPQGDYFPTSPYDVIMSNKKMNLHTLVLLDIIEEGRYMTAKEGIKILRKMEKKRKKEIINSDTIICVVSNAGSKKPEVSADSLKNLVKKDLGQPLQSLVVPGRLHFKEIEALKILAHLPTEEAEKLQKL